MTGMVVSPTKADEVRRRANGGLRRGALPDELAALLRGDMLHFDDEVQHFNRKAIRTRYGLRLRLLSDGTGGRYYWTEPLDPGDTPGGRTPR